MSMFRKYLLKQEFWPAPRASDSDKPTCYVKHDVNVGGIYAYLQHRGVKLVVDSQTKFFNNFDELDRFFDKVRMRQRTVNNDPEHFISIINRRRMSQQLRQLSI